MSKRKRDESKEERWERKNKEYQHKICEKRKKSCDIVHYPSSMADDAEFEEHLVLEDDNTIFAGFEEVLENTLAGAEPLIMDQQATPPTTEDVAAPATATQGSQDLTHAPTDDVDPDLLKALGEFEPEAEEWGDELQDEVAKRFQQILVQGLKKEVKEDLTKRYLFPKNVSLSKSPTLNPETGAMLTESCKNRDKRISIKQDQLGKALAALGKAMTMALKRNPNIPDIIRIMNDTGKLICDSHHTETDTRRSLIIPLVDKSLTEPFKNRKRDKLLFVDNLGDLVKSSRSIKKTGQLIQVPSSSNPSLNWKGLSSRPRPSRGGQPSSRYYGQQRMQYPNRRRAPPPPPHAHRRGPPPPPPPPPATARRRQAQAQRPPQPPTDRPLQ